MEKKLKIYTVTDHDGFYPVGVASVIVAVNKGHAARLLDKALIERGLAPKKKHDYTLSEVPTDEPVAIILDDGNY